MNPRDIRSVTDDEVAQLRDHGWVKLERLISPELAGELLERAKRYLGPDGDGLSDYHDVIEQDERFASLGLDPRMGRNVQRLVRRNIGILMWSNLLAVKVGAKQGSPRTSEPTPLHQDGPDLPIDRPGWVRFWIALDRVTEDMGPIRFVDSSHRLGMLGRTYLQREGRSPEAALFDEYPEIAGMPVVEPLAFEPGDASAYGMYTLHGERANGTDKPRWTLVLAYLADDTLYSGNQLCEGDAVRKIRKAGLAPGERFGGPQFPRVCRAG